LVSLKLDEKNLIALDDPVSAYLEGLPEDKQAITIRQLLTHTHGLTDFYHSADFEKDTGIHSDNASAEALTAWSLNQPLAAQPGSVWTYNVVGYAVLGMVLQSATGLSFSDLAQREVFDPLHMVAYYGNSDTVIDGQSPTLYELVDDKVVTHPVEFRPFVYPAAGLNISVAEMAKLFAALSGDRFLSTQQKTELWRAMELPDGKSSFYGLGWFSYTTSQNRWVVGHEGGGASWIIYYPDQQLSVIALSNMSGARADMLPFDIARAAFDAALFE
jgi:CubicO group peptidase (beta-lactamase class C family)